MASLSSDCGIAGISKFDWFFSIETELEQTFLHEILQDLLESVAKKCQERSIERKIYPHAVHSCAEIMLDYVKWLFLQKDSQRENYTAELGWIPEEEPLAIRADAWSRGSVPLVKVPPVKKSVADLGAGGELKSNDKLMGNSGNNLNNSSPLKISRRSSIASTTTKRVDISASSNFEKSVSQDFKKEKLSDVKAQRATFVRRIPVKKKQNKAEENSQIVQEEKNPELEEKQKFMEEINRLTREGFADHTYRNGNLIGIRKVKLENVNFGKVKPQVEFYGNEKDLNSQKVNFAENSTSEIRSKKAQKKTPPANNSESRINSSSLSESKNRLSDFEAPQTLLANSIIENIQLSVGVSIKDGDMIKKSSNRNPQNVFSKYLPEGHGRVIKTIPSQIEEKKLQQELLISKEPMIRINSAGHH